MRRTLAILALLMAVFAFKGLLLVPPAPTPGSEFDTGRALARLDRILGDQRAHPVDSAANDSVRARILEELAEVGLRGEVREAPNCNALPGRKTVSCALTRNIVAVIGGSRPGKALLLNAHYDSTPSGPGAADDGIGVATLLEVAANLQAHPPAQPVILLFNEGEEFGLNGAAAFAAADPLAARVGSLINIEARGVSGPAWMFETSEPNAAPIGAFARASARPYANSLTADAAKLIPNYTDVVVFKEAPRTRGWRILSFAIVGNETRYHTPGDRIEWLDRSSVHHMGSQVLAAARTLPAAGGGGSERVFADIAGRWFISLPLVVAEVLLGLLLGGAMFAATQQRAFGRPLLACAAAVSAGVAVAFGLDWAGTMLRPGDYWRAYPIIPYLALYAATLAAMSVVLARIGPRTADDRLRAACWLLILALGALLSAIVNGAIIFFLLAPALALAGLFIPALRSPLLWAAALLHLVMFGELMASVEMLLIDGPLAAVAPLAALAALPLLVEIADRSLDKPALALGAIALALWIGALAMPRASAARPAVLAIDYVRDEIAQLAHWAVSTKQAALPAGYDGLGPWRRGALEYNGRTRWLAKAPALDVAGGRASEIGQARAEGRRLVRLRLALGGGDALALRIDPKARVLAVGLPGKLVPIPPGKAGEPVILRCMGRACDGLILDIAIAGAGPAAAMLVTTRFALPRQGAALAARRPRDAQPQYGPDSSVRVSAVTL